MKQNTNKSREDKSFDKALEKIQKQYGAAFVTTVSKEIENTGIQEVQWIRTGVLAFDVATGGGLPRGLITEIFGGESVGKTTLMLTAIATAQKAGLRCAFVDAEYSYDPVYAAKIGVDNDELIISHPEYAEQAYDIMGSLIKMKVDLIVADSLAAFVPKRELDEGMSKETMALGPRLAGRFLRKNKGAIKNAQVSVVCIQQLREKFGVMFGEKSDSPGGRALKHAYELRVRLNHIGTIKDSGNKVANRIRCMVKKSKVGIQNIQGEYNIIYGKGVDRKLDLFDTALNINIMHHKTINGKKRIVFNENKFIDYEDFCDQIKEDPTIKKNMIKMIRAHKNTVGEE